MRIFGLLFLLCLSFSLSSVSQNSRETVSLYEKQETMIPMRDGIKLFTRIYTPKDSKEDLPILMMRTPYSEHNMGTVYPDKDSYVKNMAAEGYIFVYQNIRGKQKSEGIFVMQRPIISDKDSKAIDESTDTYDAIDWLLKNIKGNNGKVGQLGISYPGWTSQVSAVKPHPALKAASPQATMGDLSGDDFHHNGAFRLSYGFEYSFEEEAAKGDTTFPFPQYDLYEWYLNLGSLANANSKYFHRTLPTWNHFAEHPNYDDFWQKQSLAYRLDSQIPTPRKRPGTRKISWVRNCSMEDGKTTRSTPIIFCLTLYHGQ
jgi:predicted acyl esterase